VRRIETDGELPDRPDLGDEVDPDDPVDVPPALYTWSRLEPLPQTPDLQPALTAAIADPLWLLARQWQFLEFAGEDAGTPVDVRVTGEAATLSRFLAGPLAGPFANAAADRARDLDPTALPLETRVEAEPVRAVHPRLVAEAGLHLRRLLAAADLLDLFESFADAYPLDLAEAVAGDANADWLELARGRALDSRMLAAALRPLREADGTLRAVPASPTLPEPARERVRGLLAAWLSYVETDVVEPDADSAWNPRRVEYAFAAAAATSADPVVLVADEYADGSLDWQSVDAAPGDLGAPAGAPETITLPPVLPSPVGYSGAPARRFWEFEDANVRFGNIDAGPTDLVRLLLVEFALIYGDDWFVVPARLPVGSLFRTTSFEVRDTFGVVTQVPRVEDPSWSMFEVAGAGGLFLAPVLADDALSGAPLEEVALFRDEMANMAWGVERRVQGASGDGYDRADEASRAAASQVVDGPPVEAQLVYRLATSVPEHWIPLVPVAAPESTPDRPVVELQRRVLVRTERDGTQRRIEPRGAVLGVDGDLRLAEEEVPREGAVVQRAFQYARWFDGRSLVWLGRRTRAGRGEGASGLRFDALTREAPRR
jgi:hypothetical protein